MALRGWLAALLVLGSVVTAHAQTTTIVAFADLACSRRAPVFATARGHGPQRVLWLGDRCHAVAAGSSPTRADIQRNHRQVQGLPGLPLTPPGADWKKSGLAVVPQTDVYDDHELGNNTDRTTPNMDVLIEEHQLAYPAPYASAHGIWHTLVEGHVRLIALDARAQREPYGTDGIDAMLGLEQRLWFEATLVAASEPWIVILSSVPLAPDAKPLDAWASKPIAQARMDAVLALLCDGRCLVLSADMHTGGGYRRTPWGAEVTTPHANLGAAIAVWGSCGVRANCGFAWDGLTRGKGRPGYVLIRAAATSLTAEVRGANDRVRWTVVL